MSATVVTGKVRKNKANLQLSSTSFTDAGTEGTCLLSLMVFCYSGPQQSMSNPSPAPNAPQRETQNKSLQTWPGPTQLHPETFSNEAVSTGANSCP